MGISYDYMSNPLEIIKIIDNPNNNNEYIIYYTPNISLIPNTKYYFKISNIKLIYFTPSETLELNKTYYLEVPP